MAKVNLGLALLNTLCVVVNAYSYVYLGKPHALILGIFNILVAVFCFIVWRKVRSR